MGTETGWREQESQETDAAADEHQVIGQCHCGNSA